ncbi:hypothetical protein L596_003677 [Steinernema carpocapsae]|uniref:Kelch repeat protein n=1 Tax=Steinernema carpocapsae TaxID=34508 RepID=A0A4U8UUD9_STECR|nr:hypothetical protein L596_003677 [Steinernema carpocapsae]
MGPQGVDCDSCDPAPGARSGHRMFCDGGYVYLLGGFNPKRDGSSLIQDLWAFNVLTDEWTKVNTTGHFPQEMASFSLAQNNNRNCTFLFGGTAVPFGQKASNKLFAATRSRFDQWNWQEIVTVGDNRPLPIYGQSMAYIEGDGIYVIGGTTGFHYNMDVHKLKQPLPGPLTSEMLMMPWEWSLECPGTPSEPGRYRHEMVSVDGGFVIIGGGGFGDGVDVQHQRPWFHINSNDEG